MLCVAMLKQVPACENCPHEAKCTNVIGATDIDAQRLYVRNDGFSCFGSGPAVLRSAALFNLYNINIPCGGMGEQGLEPVVQCSVSGR
jgi:hypothetical protein